MPCVRGIVVNLITSSNPKGLPEFPHPEVSSACLIEPSDHSLSDVNSFSILCLDAKSLRPQTAALRGSVILSPWCTDQGSEGLQFWIQYSIEPLAAPPRYLFFKIFMNGRSVVNLGIDPTTQETGCIKRALYEPEERWNQEMDGSIIMHTIEGIEARYFHFLAISAETSVADDGGLIEVQVYRAKGRKRRAPQLVRYRTQETFGIAFPSDGFVDRPEEALHYDWLLIDPKHSPYASFRFHYRSWENLRQLSLVPPCGELELDVVSSAISNETDTRTEELQPQRPLPAIPEAHCLLVDQP